jgi:hypothetical protein
MHYALWKGYEPWQPMVWCYELGIFLFFQKLIAKGLVPNMAVLGNGVGCQAVEPGGKEPKGET